jgi:hypothetical protein
MLPLDQMTCLVYGSCISIMMFLGTPKPRLTSNRAFPQRYEKSRSMICSIYLRLAIEPTQGLVKCIAQTCITALSMFITAELVYGLK